MGAALSPVVRAAAALEMRRRRRMRVEASGLMNKIPEAMTFRQWCDKLASEGMKVDGKPFRLDNRPALVPIYDAIPCTREQAFERVLVIQKATQLGLTVWEVLANIYMAIKWGPITIGMFLPDQATAAYKSEHRFMRIVRSTPEIYRAMTTAIRGEKEKAVGEGNVLTRTMGESIFLFLWTTGRVSTESRPMDVVTLDEVQEMDLADIDKVRNRTGDSDVAFTLLLSTANMPEMDINFWYLHGDQKVWHTECGACGEFSDLSDPAGVFPGRSVAYNTGQFPLAEHNEYVWCCPHCKAHIPDPQRGRYIAMNPGAPATTAREAVDGEAPEPMRRIRQIESFLLPRTISPRMKSPRAMVEGLARAKTGDQKKSFYNRALARPYIDADQLPVTMAHCEAAAAEGMRMGVKWETEGSGYYMGIDQMGGFNAVIIKKRLPDGRQGVVHVEAVFDLDPFARCSELMKVFGIAVCVVEQLPNVNDARKFANKHKGKVFIAGYQDLKNDHMLWGDQLAHSDIKTAEDDRSRYTVNLQQYRCMQTSLFRIRGEVQPDGKLLPMCLFPDPGALEQDVIDDGVKKRILLLRDWVFFHFTKTALVVVEDPDTRKSRTKVQKVGIDPHFSYANMLCDVAWARNHGTTTFILPTGPEATPLQKDLAAAMPGLDPRVVQLVREQLPSGDVCGRCTGFDAKTGMCRERMLSVAAADPACTIFMRVDES